MATIPKTICLLGRQPALGLAELESIYGAEHVWPAGRNGAYLDIEAGEINFKQLGGTIKVARVLAQMPDSSWPSLINYLYENVPGHLEHLPAGKLTLGLSLYGVEVKLETLNKGLLKLKKIIKDSGKPVRIVPNKSPALSSAQVLHNKLTRQGAWELIFYNDGTCTYLAQTIFVQDIEAYAARDQARPKRDARIGMLPPKLAQIMINLATGPLDRSKPSRIRLLDPFCGTGVILQEAMLMGFSVIGSDIDERMVDYAKQNLQWLVRQNPQIQALADVEVGDATSAHWSGFSAVASEAFLGRPLSTLPSPDKLKPIINDVNTITRKFLKNLSSQIKPGRRLCLAVPAWRNGQKFINLPVIDHLTEMGYTQLDLKHVPARDLIYFRENQTVARQLLILTKESNE
jgi:tRNA G10  N-methylase Trm11